MKKPECECISTDRVTQDLHQWLQDQAQAHHLKYLLAHADDGVIWGIFDTNYSLTTSYDVFEKGENNHSSNSSKNTFNPVSLRLCTLQQCRLFGATTEVMLWKGGENYNVAQSWRARYIKDEGFEKEDFISENQILWGTQVEEMKDGFTLLSDGSQGLQHAVPIPEITLDPSETMHRPVRLCVRHYVDYDNDGLARIYLSRLVDLTANSSTEETDK